MEQLLLREDEAKAVTQWSKTTLWRLRRSGELGVVKVGRSVRYPLSEIQRLIDRRLEDAEPALTAHVAHR